jgi:hypothetical protein
LQILTCKSTRKRSLERFRYRWEDNIRIHPCEHGIEPLGSISHEVVVDSFN